MLGHCLLTYTNCTFSYYIVSSEQIQEKYYGNGLSKKDKTSLGVQ